MGVKGNDGQKVVYFAFFTSFFWAAGPGVVHHRVVPGVYRGGWGEREDDDVET
jgi:hypothetical protein